MHRVHSPKRFHIKVPETSVEHLDQQMERFFFLRCRRCVGE
jgi:hypothetical protein